MMRHFQQWPYQRAEQKPLINGMRKARMRLRLAISPAAAIQAVTEIQALLGIYQSQSAVARIRHDQKTDDPFYTAEQAYYDQTDARVAQETQAFYTAMLGSRHRMELENHYGSLIFRKAENLREIVQDKIVEDLAEENRLASDYLQLMSAAAIPLDGKVYTLAQLEPLLQSPDRQVRQAVHRAEADWLASRAASLDALFDQLVSVRNRISSRLGLASFIEVGYKRMERFDYQRSQIEALRQAVVRYIVPLTGEIRRLQRRRLNLDALNYYDLPCLFPAGNPQLQIPLASLPDQTSRLLASLTGQDPSFLRRLSDSGCLDLEARPNKAPGGYCETIVNAGMPFILMNASGTAQDVTTLLHESGHAYASLCSLPDLTLLEYRQPTLETCEIHSTALEFLSYPLMEPFFGSEAENYTLMHMTETLLFIPYACMVDEFQHVIYEQPGLTPEQRHQVWQNLECRYQPDLNYGDDSFYNKGGAWQKKQHIFVSPFYYIDYLLADLVALDLWHTSRKDPAKAWKQYDRLCRLGGRDTFLKLLEQAGLASPFDIGTIKKVAYAACDFLRL
ncbi:MAG TPA: M3 family oligoendopeptidase [Clostridiales bacterium]|nr:M3 family oligoendopeptidase [Clostridiales bacterium]